MKVSTKLEAVKLGFDMGVICTGGDGGDGGGGGCTMEVGLDWIGFSEPWKGGICRRWEKEREKVDANLC